MIDPEAFTLSESKRTFGQWIRQKNRHFTTGKYYKPKHKFILGLYSISQFLYYPLFIASIIFYDWRIVLGVFGVRLISQAIVYRKAMKKLNELDLFPWWLVT